MIPATTIVTEPTAEPLTLTEVKDSLRDTPVEDDALVSVLITAARRAAEAHTHRVFVTQTWDYFADKFPASAITFLELPRPPLVSVTSIKYTDTDGVQQTWDSSKYVVDTHAERGRILPAWSEIWPSTRQVMNAVEIRFVAGYGVPDDVPEDIRTAMLLQINHLYDHRQSVVIGAIGTVLPLGVKALLSPYISKRF